MPTTFGVIYLGAGPQIDPTAGDFQAHNHRSENATALVGDALGSLAAPLDDNFQAFSIGSTRYSDGVDAVDDTADDRSMPEDQDAFRLNGAGDQMYDEAVVYNATVTYIDGTTALISAVVYQDTGGTLYLAPDASNNMDQVALEANAIQSLTLDSVSVDASDMLAGRMGRGFVAPDGRADEITDFDISTGIGGIGTVGSARNGFIDLSPFYNATTLAAWNAANPDQTYATLLEWLQTDQAEGTLNEAGGLQILDGGIVFDSFDLRVENTDVACFASGTLIATMKGEVRVEDLRPGDRILTMDHGFQPLRWAGSQHLCAHDLVRHEHLRPIRIRKEATGLSHLAQDLIVSPQHRIMIASKVAQRMFDSSEILIAAKQLLALDGIDIAHDIHEVTYHHILFEHHEVVFANGIHAESLYLDGEAMKALSPAGREQIVTLFPELALPGFALQSCRPIVAGKRAEKVAFRHSKNRKPLVVLGAHSV